VCDVCGLSHLTFLISLFSRKLLHPINDKEKKLILVFQNTIIIINIRKILKKTNFINVIFQQFLISLFLRN